MKSKHCLFTGFIFLHIVVHAQVKIGNNSTAINSASLLELETTNKGFVLPRVSLTSVSSSSPLPSGLLTGTVVYNTNAGVTNGSGTGLYYWNGSSWITVTPSISATAWSLTGNPGTNYNTNFIGTTDNVGFRIRTNNIERFLIDSLGDIGIGSSAFNALNREKLLIDYGVTTSHTLANLKGSINDYLQINLQNYNSGISASTDYVATADDGTDSTYYIDMGINSSTYSRAAHNWGSAHDGYLYTNSKNLLIGTATSNDIVFMTGGGLVSSNAVLRLKASTGNIVVGKGDNTANLSGNIIRGPNGNGSSIAGGSLTLNGGSATDNAIGGSVNINGGTSVLGTAGNVNINTDVNSNTYLNTGTSTGNIILGNALNNINVPKLSASSVVLTDASKNLSFTTPSSNTYLFYNGSSFTWQYSSPVNWSITGNAGTIASTNFVGTTDAIDFVTKTNSIERMRVTSGGNVGINTPSPGSALDVKGTLRLSGSSSGYVALAPAAAAGSTTYTLPAADGTAGQALITNGSGTLSWAITAATIGTIGTGATIAGTATGKYYCTGSSITLPPGKFIVNVYMMLSSTTNPMTQTISNTPGSFFIKSFFADATLGTTAGATVSPALPQSNVSPDVVGNGKLISGSLNVGQTYNPISGFVVINNTSGANKSYYYWAGWVSLTNVSSSNSLPLIGGTNYGEDNIVAYPTN